MPPIGETLKEARMRQKLDIADVEERTKIRAKYLRALENEEWALLPGPTFVKTFLRTYAEVVGVDPHLLVEEYRASHEPQEEPEPAPLGGQSVGARRESRRRGPPGPPGKAAVLGALVVAVVAFLLVLGLVSGDDDDSGSQRADTTPAPDRTARAPAPKPRRPKRPPAKPAAGVTLRLAPTTPTYACLDTGESTGVVFEGILEAPRSFKHGTRLRVNLGKRSVEMRLNGKPVPIPPSSEPVGFDLTPKGASELPEGKRPCA